MLNIVNYFSAFIEMIIRILFSILLMWHVTLTDLQILNYPCFPGINSTWSWCMIVFMYCWIQFTNILLRTVALMFMRVMTYTSHVLFWFWYQNNAGIIKWIQKYSHLFHSLEDFQKDWQKLMLMFSRIHQWNLLALVFLCWKVLNYWSVQFFCFFMVQSLYIVLYAPKKSSIASKLLS